MYVVPPEFQHIGDDIIKRQALDDALAKFNDFNEKSELPQLVVPKDVKKTTRAYYDFLTQFIVFANQSGEYDKIRITGEGKPIRMRAPAMQFNDIRNDPYFIVK